MKRNKRLQKYMYVVFENEYVTHLFTKDDENHASLTLSASYCPKHIAFLRIMLSVYSDLLLLKLQNIIL